MFFFSAVQSNLHDGNARRATFTVNIDVYNSFKVFLCQCLCCFKLAAMSQELIWADTEENPFLLVLFGKLAELQYMYSEAEKQMAEKVRKPLGTFEPHLRFYIVV